MLVSGPHNAIEARYPAGGCGLAITRDILDAWLLESAIRAGARFEAGLVVRAPLLESRSPHPVVRGLQLSRRGDAGTAIRMPATVTIAADGRRSATARALGLINHPPRPRRWAYGTYATNVAGASDVGEMHIRRGFYFGIAPLGDGRCNVCAVTSGRPSARSPIDVIRHAIGSDPMLADRLRQAAFEPTVRVLGPLAVDAAACGADGLLLAGDAAGFVDPMTGDGLHLAMRGAILAAEETLRVLIDGRFTAAPDRLRRAREQMFGRKLQFNRLLRTLVGSPAAIRVAGSGARVAPGLVRRAVAYAGDAA
jgi:flavin-dependent dehydrogenase